MAGSVDKCAQLSTAACVVCTHLGGRYFANLAAGASQAESLEVRQSLGHCYILDKSLAMTLGRRSFLPEMEVDAAMLIPPAVEKPSAPIFNVYIEFAKIQDSIARDMRAHHPSTSSKRLEAVNSLRKRMKDIRVKIREVSGPFKQPLLLIWRLTVLNSFACSPHIALSTFFKESGWV